MSGRHFPGYDVVAQAAQWDDVTAGVVLARLGPPPRVRFFTIDEEATCRALLDRLLAMDDSLRVPVFELIDSRLAEHETDGWHYDDMPEDGAAWRSTLCCLDDDAQEQYGQRFATCRTEEQGVLLESVHTADKWHGFVASRVWSLWMRYACAAFYSHPLVWNEIGFPGPAYPRGYAALGLDQRDHWEMRERNARDPLPWAERVRTARARHARIAGTEHPGQ